MYSFVVVVDSISVPAVLAYFCSFYRHTSWVPVDEEVLVEGDQG